MSCQNIFDSVPGQTEIIKKERLTFKLEKEKRYRKKIKSIIDNTLDSLPTQIAKSRLDHPRRRWIPIKFSSTDATTNKTTAKQFLEHIKEKGFIARLRSKDAGNICPSRTYYITIRDADVPGCCLCMPFYNK